MAYNPGVTDPVKDSVMKAIKDLGILNVRAVATAKRYLLRGEVTPPNWISLPAVCWLIPSSSMLLMRILLNSRRILSIPLNSLKSRYEGFDR